jgi:hypothetical protein
MTKQRDPYPHERDPTHRELAEDLQATLDRVGDARYGQETARHFAKGGKYNPRPRRRYAIT